MNFYKKFDIIAKNHRVNLKKKGILKFTMSTLK